MISLDDYYRDLSHLSIEERAKSNFDDPIAIERDLIHEHISLLRNGVRSIDPVTTLPIIQEAIEQKPFTQ